MTGKHRLSRLILTFFRNTIGIPRKSQLLCVFGRVSGEKAHYIIMSLLGRRRLIALNRNTRDNP